MILGVLLSTVLWKAIADVALAFSCGPPCLPPNFNSPAGCVAICEQTGNKSGCVPITECVEAQKPVVSIESSGKNPYAQVINVANQSYYGGTIQIAAGVTQVSEAAVDRMKNGTNDENRQTMATGLTNLSAGNNSVREARAIVDRVNNSLTNEIRNASVGVKKTEVSYGLSFEKLKAGAAGNQILEKMEQATGIEADALIHLINSGEPAYDLAATAKGLKMTPKELQDAAEAAVAKLGKSQDSELGDGLKLSDVLSDLNMLMPPSKVNALVSDDKQMPIVSEEVAVIASPAVSREPSQNALRRGNAVLSSFAETTFGELEQAKEKSLFQMISSRYKKVSPEFFNKSAH